MKKILIFSSYGGGGHISATDALNEYLQKDYDITTVYLIDEVLGCLDPLKILSFKKYTEEKFYNFCLKKKWTWFINKMYQLANLLVYYNESIIKRIIIKYIKQQNPDLIISVIPIFNNILKKSCQECNIPFLLIPTDLDSTSFVKNIQPPINDKFLLSLSFENQDILNFTKNIPDDSRVFSGFPIKSSFFESKNHTQIKKDFNVPENKPVILILMGAAGSKATYNYLLTLLELKFPVHLILCLGRNEELRTTLQKIQKPDHITVSIISYTNRIADLMSISDLCITKAGTVSVCETIYMNIPMILDNTSTPLLWEKFNINFIQKHKFGSTITHYKQLSSLVTLFMTDSAYYATCKNNLINFPKKKFGDYIQDVIARILT